MPPAETQATRNCPQCQQPMKLDKRPFPEGTNAAFVGDDRWICTNPKCNHSEIAE